MRISNIVIMVYIILIAMCLSIISCSKHIQPYSYIPQVESLYSLSKLDSIKIGTRKSIILTSDSSLNYSISLGGIGISTTINYKIIDSLIIVDSIDIYNRDTFQDYTNEVFNHKFIYTKDSLVDLINDEKYFSKKYNKKHW